jgi:hypothetical protein
MRIGLHPSALVTPLRSGDSQSITVITTLNLLGLGRWSWKTCLAAKDTLELLPAISPGKSGGWKVEWTAAKLFSNKELNVAALHSASDSFCSIAR